MMVKDLPEPLAARLTVLENLVRQAEPANCAALRDGETIIADTLALVENSLTTEAAAQSAILDCLTLADEMMRVGIYWGDSDAIESMRAQALAAIERFAAALVEVAPSAAARARDLTW